MNRTIARTVALAAAALSVGAPLVASTAHAAPRVEITATGGVEDQGWRLLAVTEASGSPFGGTLYGTLKQPFGGWPDAGECLHTDAGAYVDGPGSTSAWFLASGEVCGLHVDGTNAVRYAFTGDYGVVEATPRSLLDTEGWMEMRVTDDGRASVTLVGH
jgi:hypothetical protein